MQAISHQGHHDLIQLLRDMLIMIPSRPLICIGVVFEKMGRGP